MSFLHRHGDSVRQCLCASNQTGVSREPPVAFLSPDLSPNWIGRRRRRRRRSFTRTKKACKVTSVTRSESLVSECPRACVYLPSPIVLHHYDYDPALSSSDSVPKVFPGGGRFLGRREGGTLTGPEKRTPRPVGEGLRPNSSRGTHDPVSVGSRTSPATSLDCLRRGPGSPHSRVLHPPPPVVTVPPVGVRRRPRSGRTRWHTLGDGGPAHGADTTTFWVPESGTPRDPLFDTDVRLAFSRPRRTGPLLQPSVAGRAVRRVWTEVPPREQRRQVVSCGYDTRNEVHCRTRLPVRPSPHPGVDTPPAKIRGWGLTSGLQLPTRRDWDGTPATSRAGCPWPGRVVAVSGCYRLSGSLGPGPVELPVLSPWSFPSERRLPRVLPGSYCSGADSDLGRTVSPHDPGPKHNVPQFTECLAFSSQQPRLEVELGTPLVLPGLPVAHPRLPALVLPAVQPHLVPPGPAPAYAARRAAPPVLVRTVPVRVRSEGGLPASPGVLSRRPEWQRDVAPLLHRQVHL